MTAENTKLVTTPVRARDPGAPTVYPAPESTPSAMMVLAIQHNADPAVLQKLIDIQQQWESIQARKAYVEAMTEFKRECPSVLGRDATVDFSTSKGRTHYRHATLGAIINAITPMLSNNGLSIGWETTQSDNTVNVTCNVTHRLGHRESTTLIGPRDDSGNKNAIQAVGSAVTYLQRYTLLSALGLATADQDDDGNAIKRDPIPMPVEARETSPESAKAQPAPQSEQQGGEVISVTIGEVKSKSGGTKEKPWTRFYFKSGEDWFSTFDTKLADQLRGLNGDTVQLRIERGEKGINVLGIISDSQEPEPSATEQGELPV